MNDLNRIRWNPGLVGWAVTLIALTCSAYGEPTQFIAANLAGQADGWGETPQNGIPCMQTYGPNNFLFFDVIVPDPGAVYKISLGLVKVTNGGCLKVFIDDELQTEIDTYATGNHRTSIPVCEMFIAPGKHSLKIKSVGQKSVGGGSHLSVIGFEIVGESGSGKWQVEEKIFNFTPLKNQEASGQANLLPTRLPPRLQEEPFSIPPDSESADIFSHPLVEVNEIPFRIPKVEDVPETGRLLEEQKPLQVELPDSAREIFLLVWSKIPPIDTDSGPLKAPIAPINQSERFTAEIVYRDGTSDHLVPLNLTSKAYGLDNGLSLYVVHPGPGKVPQQLVFHDKVYKCSFALVALTCNRGRPISPEPGPGEISPWYPVVDKKFPAITSKPESNVQQNSAGVSDGLITAEFSLQTGLEWKQLGSPVFGEVTLDRSPVFAIKHTDKWIGSDQWKVTGRKASDHGVLVDLEYQDEKTDLRAAVNIALTEDGKIKMGLTLVNQRSEPFLGRVQFPILEGLKLGSLDDTWYYFSESAGAAMIHHEEGYVYASHGAGHPHQMDSFFNPNEWYTLTLLSNDLEGQFHWYDLGKAEEGGWYRLEYLEEWIQPGASWSFPECMIAISPGDWRASFRLYRDWVGTWYNPKPPAQDWYKRSFLTGTWYVYLGLDGLIAGAQRVRDLFGYCDAVNLAGWHAREHPDNPTHHPDYTSSEPGILHRQEYSGEYDRDALFPVGGEENFKSFIKKANEAGVPISPYTNPILINENAHRFGAKRHEWGFGYRPVDYGGMMGYVPCLSFQEWVDYVVESETFLARDLGVKILYLDQLGSGASICNHTDHPHKSPEPHFYGERELTKRIREAIPEDVVICSEAHPEDTRLQFQNSFYQGGLLRYLTRQIQVPMNMTRFAFPDIKCFNNIYGYGLKDNNWERLKFVLFNGDALFMSRGYGPEGFIGKEATQDYRKLFQIEHEHVDAFASSDVEPLVPTLLPGTFVNRFGTDEKVIWTVFNANYRTARGKLLEIPARPGTRYVDLWNGAPVTTHTTGDTTWLVVEIGPRDVACISEVVP
jgi:hypothetical protein